MHAELVAITYALTSLLPAPAPAARDQRNLVIAFVEALATIAVLRGLLALFGH
jgi:hypothetical protein